MEEFTSALNNLTVLLIVIGGSLFTLCVAAGAIMYMTSAGDPRRQQLARGALLSSLLGVVILAMAPIAPRVLSRFVIEPSGGQALDRVGQASCDRTFRSSLITQRGVSTDDRANSMIRQIQAQRRTECGDETWNPKIKGGVSGGNACAQKIASGPDKDTYKAVGDTIVPVSLGTVAKSDADGLTRDADGNILVWFDVAGATKYYPTDGSACWLYLASADIWDQAAGTP